MHNKGFIYKIQNQINKKIYIGCTISNLKKRFKEHESKCNNKNLNTKFCNSLKKYGIENFDIELIEECDISKIYEREVYFICEFDSFQNGLNSTQGGEGCLGYTHSTEIRNKISQNLKKGNSHKGKTYFELFGENETFEKNKRSISVKKYWNEVSKEKKNIRTNNQKKVIRKNSKYSEVLIKEIKDKFKNGKTMKEMFIEYPDFNKSYLYSIKNNRRWKDI